MNAGLPSVILIFQILQPGGLTLDRSQQVICFRKLCEYGRTESSLLPSNAWPWCLLRTCAGRSPWAHPLGSWRFVFHVPVYKGARTFCGNLRNRRCWRACGNSTSVERAIAGAGLFLLVLAWTLTIGPSNEGPWEPDVAQTAWADIDGDKVTIHNFGISTIELQPILFRTGKRGRSISPRCKVSICS